LAGIDAHVLPWQNVKLNLTPSWRLRPEPLAIAAAVACSAPAIAALHAWLHSLSAGQQTAARALHVPGLSIVFAQATDLPWFDGIAYAGQCPQVPELWLPTHLDPGLPPELLARAVLRHTCSSAALLWHAPMCTLALP
jgi:hypothetical protein